MELNELKQYIDDVVVNLDKLKLEQNDEEKQYLLYESYANLLDLCADVKDVLRGFRTEFKIKESEVKKWMAENDDEESESESKSEKKEEPEVVLNLASVPKKGGRKPVKK